MPNATVIETRCQSLTKVLTGIQGLDEITFGGLPKGRPTLLCGCAGCGKTVFRTEHLASLANNGIGNKRKA